MVTGVLLWWFIQQQHPQLWCLPSFVQPTPPGHWDQNDGASTEAGYCSCFESSSMAFRAKHEMFLFKWFYLSFSLGFGQHWTQHFLFLYCFHCPGCFKPQSRSRDCCRGRWTRVVKTRADLYTSCDMLSSVPLCVSCSLSFSSFSANEIVIGPMEVQSLQWCGSRDSSLSITQELVRMPFSGPRATESEMCVLTCLQLAQGRTQVWEPLL